MSTQQLSRIQVHVVDDDESFRTAIGRVLQASGYQVSVYDSAAAFLASDLPDEPGCILLDVNMPAVSGLQLQQHLGKLNHPLPVIFLTGHGDIAMSVRAVKAGAEDFLLKPVVSVDLLNAIERAGARYHACFDERTTLDEMRRRAATLTPREREVFGLVVQGLLNKQIAYELGNSERTVKAQRHSLMEKMNVGSLAELVIVASRLNILDAPPQ